MTSTDAALFSTLPPSIQALILATESWLSSSRNSSQLQLSSYQPSSHDVVIAVPSFSSSFTLTLSAPHSLSTDCELLEELETESFQFCFGQQQRTVEEVLDFVDAWLRKDGAGWDRARVATGGRKGRKRKVEHKETEAGGEDEAEQEPMLDDAAMSDTAAADDDDADADWQQEAADDDWGEAVEYDLVAAAPAEADASEHAGSTSTATSHPQFGSAITRADLSRLQSAMIDDVSSSLRITRSSAATLLRHCRWEQAETIRRFKAEHSKLAAEAGVAAQLHADVSPPPSSCSAQTCPICFDDASSERLFALPCSHHFCLQCWREYLRSQIEGGDVSGKNALATRCPDSKCREVLGMDACEMILGEDDEAGEALLTRYRQLLVHSFVDDSDSLAWCPRVDCDRVVLLSRRQRSIACPCGHRFCIQCKAEAHAPATCDEALQWAARDKGSENLDTKWILEQSKACPKCGTRTRKEGGCMHLVCAICHCAWCWQCVTGDARVLTSTGWQSIARVQVGDEVLSLNIDAMDAQGSRLWLLEWKPVLAKQAHAVDRNNRADDLFRMQNSGMDVIATRDHSMLLARVTQSNCRLRSDPSAVGYAEVGDLLPLQYRVSPVSQVTKNAYSRELAVISTGVNRAPAVKIVIQDLERVCDWWWQEDGQRSLLQFLGFWLGDGSLQPESGRICIGQTKAESKKWLERLLDRVFPRWWNISTEASRPGYALYRIRCPPLYNYLRLMAVGPVGYNPRDPVQLRSYPHFTKDSTLAREEQTSDYYQPDNSSGYISSWTEKEMLTALRAGAVTVRAAAYAADPERCWWCHQADWQSGNDLLLCDGEGCQRGGHLQCAGLTAPPEGEWFCPTCRPADDELKLDEAGDQPMEVEDEDEKAQGEAASPTARCAICCRRDDAAALLHCHGNDDAEGNTEFCPSTAHGDCMGPIGPWWCYSCTRQQFGLATGRASSGRGRPAQAESQDDKNEKDGEPRRAYAIRDEERDRAVGSALRRAGAVVWWNNGWWLIINGNWFYLKRWLGDQQQIADVYSRLSRRQAVALLEGFCRADGRWASIQYLDDDDKSQPHEPTGQWTCSSSSFPLIDHLQLIGQLAGAALALHRTKQAGYSTGIGGRAVTFTVDHWQLYFTFKRRGDNPVQTAALAQPVDVSDDINARDYYQYKDDGMVYDITVQDNHNFLTQRLADKLLRSGNIGVRAYSVFVGNCGGNDHHVYDCNRPPWGEHKDSTSDLNRYLWYYERFFNHSQSLKTSEQQLQATAAKMDELVSEGLHLRRTEFLQQAVRVVIQCRRVLRWTYVHAYYVANDTERELFEYRQGELEAMTEQLNKLTEAGVEELQAKRKAVLDATTALRSYMDGIENDQTTQLVKATKQQHAQAAGDEKAEQAAGKDAQQPQATGARSSASSSRSSASRQAAKKSAKEEDEWKTDNNGLIVRGKKLREPQPHSQLAADYDDDDDGDCDDALPAAEDEQKEDEAAVSHPEPQLRQPRKGKARRRKQRAEDGDEWEADIDSLHLQQLADQKQQAAAAAEEADAAQQSVEPKEVIVLDDDDDGDDKAAAALRKTETQQAQGADVATAGAGGAATAVES